MRAGRLLLGVAAAVFLLAAGTVAIAADWPSFQSELKPGGTASPNKAALPIDVKVVPPAANVPVDLAQFSGTWTGWMCRDRICSTKLAVEQLTADGGTLVYAFANQQTKNFIERIHATWDGGELAGRLSNGAIVTYRLRMDGNLDVLWSHGGEWASGILSKDP